MRRIAVLLVALATLLAPPMVQAARDLNTTPKPTTQTLRLVVMTAPGCIYCGLFRRDVQPSYETSPHGAEIPLNYIDINDDAADKLELKSPIEIVPTVVLLEGNKEVGRIPGYVSPENFFHAFNYLLAQR